MKLGLYEAHLAMFIRLLLPLLSFSLYPYLHRSLRLILCPHFSTFFLLHAASTTASMKCHLTRRKCSIQRSLQWLYICQGSVSGVYTENHKIIARVIFDKRQSYTLHRYRAVSILGAFGIQHWTSNIEGVHERTRYTRTPNNMQSQEFKSGSSI